VKRPVWVQRETVLILHEQLVAAFGGTAGLRDDGLFDSALARPENLFVYAKPTICALAASYAFGLIRNHPFLDGNKRTGFAVAALFLELNGHRFQAPEADVVVRTLALAAGAETEADYAAWLQAHAIPRRRKRA